MKIAIMTQPLGKNYGGIMQAWALQQVLKRMGHEPVTIDRQFPRRSLVYKIARLVYRATLWLLGKRVRTADMEQQLHIIQKNTTKFVENNIVISVRLDSNKALKNYFRENLYKAVIVGSDQTWRPAYSPNIYNFFLDFIHRDDIKRIAYASSYGTDAWEFSRRQTARCAELAQKFDSISVRESSGVELCKTHLNIDAKAVLDPTLLLDRSDYESLISGNNEFAANGGLFTYILDSTPSKVEVEHLICQQTGFTSYSCQPKHWLGTHVSKKVEDYILPSMTDWISSIASAEYVLTDSFHGMVFSIIFNKPFFVLSNHERGSTRFISLLSQVGLCERYIDLQNDYFAKTDFLKPIDYKEVNKKLSCIKLMSLELLESSLK